MKTKTRLGLGFGGQVLFTAILGASMMAGLATVYRQFHDVTQYGAPVVANARHLSKLVVDMETGLRGFCITQKEEFLEPYTQGVREFDLLIEEEKKLISGNPSQLATLERVERLVEDWRENAAKPEIAMARKVALATVDAEHLQEVLRAGVGKELMDDVMALGHEIEVAFSSQDDWEGAFAVEIIEKSMADREDSQRGFLITGREEFLERYEAGEQKDLPLYFARLRAIISDRGRGDELSSKVDRLEDLTHEWTHRAAEPEIAARREMNRRPESLHDIASLLEAGRGKALIDEIRRELDEFISVEEELSARRYDAAAQTAARTRNIAILLLLLALGLGIWLAAATSRAIAAPLAKLASGSERIGRGELDTRVEIGASGELGDLADAFNAMTANLEEASQEREQAEQERKRAEAALLTMQKLESLGLLAGGIAHDFNNILTAILGNLSLAKEEAEAGGELRDLLEEAQNATVSARGLTQQLLTFAKGGAPLFRVLALGPILKEACTFATRGSKSKCIFAIDDDLLPVKVDRDQLSQVLQNLVINASQAMPEGGTITVGATNAGGGPSVRVFIGDEGVGIPEDKLSRIFEPYFSSKEGGRGLGLATAHSIIKKHGGRIDVKSKMGAGTTFTLTLPAADPADLAPEAKARVIRTGAGKVLIMDDEAIVTRTLARILRKLGYECETTRDGATALEAWEKAKKSGRAFDAVVMDLTVPGGMGGQEAAKRLKALDPGVKLIVSSGYSNDPIISEYSRHGFAEVLAKPYQAEEVSFVLSKVVGAPAES